MEREYKNLLEALEEIQDCVKDCQALEYDANLYKSMVFFLIKELHIDVKKEHHKAIVHYNKCREMDKLMDEHLSAETWNASCTEAAWKEIERLVTKN